LTLVLANQNISAAVATGVLTAMLVAVATGFARALAASVSPRARAASPGETIAVHVLETIAWLGAAATVVIVFHYSLQLVPS
jgi:hypothetical protein